MKKLQILIGFLTIISYGFGQKNIRTTIGFNSGTITPSTNTVSFEGKPGFQFGLEGQFGKNIYFQPGIFYNIKNNTLNHPSLSIKKSELSISSIRIPVSLGYRLYQNEDRKLGFYVFTGPSISILSSIKHTENNILTIGDNELHDVEWTWSIGGGIDYKSFFMELGYEHGLTYTFLADNAKRKMFIFNFGYKLFF